MSAIRWLNTEMVDALHGLLIAEHGGSPGTRDDGLLASAVARPQHRAAYEEPSIADLGAAYAFGIARNHPFVDGNKRTAFMAAYVFLGLNGIRLDATEEEAVLVFRDLAAGTLDEAALTAWIAANGTPPDA